MVGKIVPGKTLLVMLESLAGTGHKIVQTRPKQATEKLEMIWFDPFVQQKVLYRELKKIKTIRKLPR